LPSAIAGHSFSTTNRAYARKDLRIAVQVRERVRFVLDVFLRVPELLPNDERREAEQHGVDHADDRINEPGHIVVVGEDVCADNSADEQRAADCERRQCD
jgi:hypothetical protein